MLAYYATIHQSKVNSSKSSFIIKYILSCVLSLCLVGLLVLLIKTILKNITSKILIMFLMLLFASVMTFVPTTVLFVNKIYNHIHKDSYNTPNLLDKFIILSCLCANILLVSTIVIIVLASYLISNNTFNINDILFKQLFQTKNNNIIYFLLCVYIFTLISITLILLVKNIDIHYSMCSIMFCIIHSVFTFFIL